MSSSTPKRALIKPRKSSLGNSIVTASTPNLAAAYTAQGFTTPLRVGALLSRRPSHGVLLTKGSVAALPDARQGYGLNLVLDEDSPTQNTMASFTSAQREDGDLEVGDLVDVPGNMHGVVKFVGIVQGKKGIFAGVELSEAYASKGKNSGEVDG